MDLKKQKEKGLIFLIEKKLKYFSFLNRLCRK